MSDYYIFISYARRDGMEVAQELYRRLQEQGHRVFFDIDILTPGDNWMQVINNALKQTRVFVAILTQGWLESEFCRIEFEYAVGKGITILPIMFQDLRAIDLPVELQGIQWLDWREQNYKTNLMLFDHVIDNLEGFSSPPSQASFQSVEEGGENPPNKPPDNAPIPSGESGQFRKEFHYFQDDRPEGEDYLDYERYARAFREIVYSDRTETPLTVGIFASWGSGKSFLMRKTLEQLRTPISHEWQQHRFPQFFITLFRYPLMLKPTAKPNILAVEFDAWIYSASDNLWASLITRMYEATEKYYGFLFSIRFRLLYSLRHPNTVLLMVLFFVLVFVFVGLGADEFATALALLTTLVGFVAASAKTARDFIIGPSGDIAQAMSRKNLRSKIGYMASIKRDLRVLARELERTNTRLVLFIDDIDRCVPEKSVEVLEAIMLLLTEQENYVGRKRGMPIVIFLGLDARIMVKSIEDRFGEVLRKAGVTGYEYLDKIVQIPFRIPPAKDEKLVRYAKHLLSLPEKVMQVDNLANQKKYLEDLPATDLDLQQEKVPASVTLDLINEDEPDDMDDFVERLRAVFEEFGPFLSRNPRRIKRIINIYRLVHLLTDMSIHDQRKLVKWIILCEQWPFRMAWILQQIEDDIQTASGFYQQQGASIEDVYNAVKPFVLAEQSHPLIVLDSDPEQFDNFIRASEKSDTDTVNPEELTVRFIHEMRYFTFNLNPAMQSEVLKDAIRRLGTENQPDTA